MSGAPANAAGRATGPVNATAQPGAATFVAAPARRPRRPTAFLPGFAEPEAFETLDALAARILALAAGRPLSFCAGAAAYPGFDTFPSVTAYGAGAYLATVAVPGRPALDAREALARACGAGLDDAA